LSSVIVMFSFTPKGQSICKISLLRVNMKTIKTNRALNMAKKKTDLSLNSFKPAAMRA
jgi:hypothetical protein